MRVDVKKFLFVGAREDRDSFFAAAQHLGKIHFIERPGRKIVVEQNNNISHAIKIVRTLPPLEQEEFDDYSSGDSLADRIIELKKEQDNREEEIRLLNIEIARIRIFGDFNLEDVAYIQKEANIRLRYFTVKSSHKKNSEGNQDDPFHRSDLFYVGSDFGLDYFVALDDGTHSYSGLVELYIERPVGVLREQLNEAKIALKEIEKNLLQEARYNRYLHHVYLHKLNTVILDLTRQEAVPELEEYLFTIQGWVPVGHIDDMKRLCAEKDVIVEEVSISSEDKIPTFLENQGVARIGEDLVQIYDTPSSQEKDPSLWVLFSFALFFAMIVGDAGYGMIYLGVAFYIGYKFPNLKGGAKRALNMVKILAVSCIIWGVLTNAYFAMDPHPESPIRNISLIHWLAVKKADYHHHHQDQVYKEWVTNFPAVAKAKSGKEVILAGWKKDAAGNQVYQLLGDLSRSILFEIALFVGAVHVIISLLRSVKSNPGALGWIVSIIGGYLYFSGFLKSISIPFYVFGIPYESGVDVGKQMLFGGMGWALLFAVIRHKFLGLLDVMQAVQIFADIMSYLRLYALGLAGAIVGTTINEMAGALPFTIAAVLIVIAHIMNMFLGIISGVIHGLRLNFLEWYHYSFEGGGKKFRPLKFLDIE